MVVGDQIDRWGLWVTLALNAGPPLAGGAVLAVVSIRRRAAGAARPTVRAYLDALEGVFVYEAQPAWNARLLSRTPLRSAPKHHLVDPSLAAAALGASAESLSGDRAALGLLFESMVVRHAQTDRSAVFPATIRWPGHACPQNAAGGGLQLIGLVVSGALAGRGPNLAPPLDPAETQGGPVAWAPDDSPAAAARPHPSVTPDTDRHPRFCAVEHPP